MPENTQAAAIGPRQEAFRTEAQMLDHGFPRLMTQAFLEAAERLQCVIMSRAPGKATTDLIDEGYDLKGFFIKAKSCDWGPMAGFLCELPPFNKYGAGGLVHNHTNNQEYVQSKFPKYFATQFQPAVIPQANRKIQEVEAIPEAQRTQAQNDELNRARQQLTKATSAGDTNQREQLPSIPFIPLKISDARKKALLSETGQQTYGIRPAPSGPNNNDEKVLGIAFNEDVSVVMEFKLVRDQTTSGAGNSAALWQVFYGSVYINMAANKVDYPDGASAANYQSYYDIGFKWRYFAKKQSKILTRWQKGAVQNPDLVPDADQQVLQTLRDGLNLGQISPVDRLTHQYRPLLGIQNPFPHYGRPTNNGPDLTYLNAVSGDYDLFAVWPLAPNEDPMEALMRASESTWARPPVAKNVDNQNQASAPRVRDYDMLFTRPFKEMNDKPLSVIGTRAGSRQIIIDVVPGFKEINSLEDPMVGNLNQHVEAVGQLLNSLATYLYREKSGQAGAFAKNAQQQGWKGLPNRAFHADEGGRPGVVDLDLPVGIFLPQSLIIEQNRSANAPDPTAGGSQKKVGGGPLRIRAADPTRIMVLDEPPAGIVDFVDIIDWLQYRALVSLNLGWLLQLGILCQEESDIATLQNKAPEELTEYLIKRAKERQALISFLRTIKRNDQAYIRSTLQKIFFANKGQDKFEELINLLVDFVLDTEGQKYPKSIDKRNALLEIGLSELNRAAATA